MQGIRTVLVSFLFIISVSACAEEKGTSGTTRVETEDAAIAEALRNKLDSQGIWYNILDETSVVVKQESPERVIRILNEIGKPVLPEGRHASFPNATHDKVVAELKKNKIPFEIVNAFNDKWIVWKAKDTDEVMKIIDSVTIPRQ